MGRHFKPSGEELQQAWGSLPEGWFTGGWAFRRAAIDVFNYQAFADALKRELLKQGKLEQVHVGREYRYRKVGG